MQKLRMQGFWDGAHGRADLRLRRAELGMRVEAEATDRERTAERDVARVHALLACARMRGSQ